MWPFSKTRFALDNIFIVDPLYTIPFLLLLVVALFYGKETKLRRGLNLAALLLSSTYLLWSFGIQSYAGQHFAKDLGQQYPQASYLKTSPERFTTFLWRGLAEDEANRYLSRWSIFDTSQQLTRKIIPKNDALLKDYQANEDIEKILQRRNHRVAIREQDGVRTISMLQFGIPA
ncbi:MAG: hypothetical protein H6765_04905 [Candidatus Peribacteria bacterium]|nr:MAG: hypothetical protein H6765_04905 [Candidatus Peribacteria bacterium]